MRACTNLKCVFVRQSIEDLIGSSLAKSSKKQFPTQNLLGLSIEIRRFSTTTNIHTGVSG